MSRQPLPEYLRPDRLAIEQRSLEGSIAASAMRRLGEAVSAVVDDAEAQLSFGIDTGRRKVVSGTAQAEVDLICQRCLGAVRLPLAVEFRLAVVGSEAEAERLPEDYEPLIYDGRPLRTAELIEEELILALPIVAMHDEGDSTCISVADVSASSTEFEEDGDDNKPNPFDVLKQLKKRER